MEGIGPTKTQLRALMAAREAATQAEERADRLKQEKRALEEEVAEAIEAADIKGAHTVDLGPPWGVQGFVPSERVYGRIYDEAAFHEWVKARGFEQTMTTVDEPRPRKAAVNQWVKRAPNVGEELPDGVERGATRYVTVTDRNPRA